MSKCQELMNILSQSLYHNVGSNGRFSAPHSSEEIAEETKNAVPLKTRQSNFEIWLSSCGESLAENRKVLTHLGRGSNSSRPEGSNARNVQFFFA